MPRRTISLAGDAYERLRRNKRPNESYSDVIRRLTPGRSILDLASVMSPNAARQVAAAMRRSRAEQRALPRNENR